MRCDRNSFPGEKDIVDREEEIDEEEGNDEEKGNDGCASHPAPCPPRAQRCPHRRERAVGARAGVAVTDPA